MAVLDAGLAALAPRCHVICVHFCEFPDSSAIGIVADGAVGAERFAGQLWSMEMSASKLLKSGKEIPTGFCGAEYKLLIKHFSYTELTLI